MFPQALGEGASLDLKQPEKLEIVDCAALIFIGLFERCDHLSLVLILDCSTIDMSETLAFFRSPVHRQQNLAPTHASASAFPSPYQEPAEENLVHQQSSSSARPSTHCNMLHPFVSVRRSVLCCLVLIDTPVPVAVYRAGLSLVLGGLMTVRIAGPEN